jgi:hypothetical protein
VQRLEVLLLHLLEGDKTHGGPRHGFTDRFGIRRIMLVRLHIRFDKLGGDQFDRVTVRTKTACPLMGTAAGFHPDEDGGKPHAKGEQRLPRQAFPEYDFPSLIHPYDMKDPLCQIDPDDAQLRLHWTRLLLGWNDVFLTEIILTYESRSAKAGPLH